MLNLDEFKELTVYRKDSSAWFRKKADPRFELSNIPTFEIFWPLLREPANRWPTSEHLYQASKYDSKVQCLPESNPNADPFVRNRIKAEKTALGAKGTQKCAVKAGFVRKDWETNEIRIQSMLWVLELKLYWNSQTFGRILAATGTLPIVEVSSKSDFWGAKEQPNGNLTGRNVLGKLLTHLRPRMDAVKKGQFTFPDGFLLP